MLVVFSYTLPLKKSQIRNGKSTRTRQTHTINWFTDSQTDRRYLSGDSVKQLRLIGQWATRPTALPTCQQEMPTLPHCLTGQNQPTTTNSWKLTVEVLIFGTRFIIRTFGGNCAKWGCKNTQKHYLARGITRK